MGEHRKRGQEAGQSLIANISASFTLPRLIILFFSGLLAACTSAPIDMAASEVDESLVREQAELRALAQSLSDLIDENEWTLTENSEDATRSFLGRLIGGADAEASEVEAPSRVALYLEAEPELAWAVTRDIEQIVLPAGQLAQLAISVASADGQLPADALARDIAASESALGAVRRAKAFFAAIGGEAELAEDHRALLSASLERLARSERALAVAADALAERRWATRTGLFG